MKKLFILFLVVLFGFSMIPFNATADSTRTIKRLSGAAVSENTVIKSNGGTLYHISGFADTAACVYSVHDASSINVSGATTEGTKSNVISEGGEATQYDSVPSLNFGEDGIRFNNGLIVMTANCTIALSYD